MQGGGEITVSLVLSEHKLRVKGKIKTEIKVKPDPVRLWMIRRLEGVLIRTEF